MGGWRCTGSRLGRRQALRSGKLLLGGTRPREVDGMEARRFSTVARSLGSSVLVLLVMVLVACGNSETKSGGGGVSVGREPAGVDSPSGSGPDLAQSSEGAVGITEDPAPQIGRASCRDR